MLISFKETSDLIKSGKLLHIAADETLLSKLPVGNWVGGTTPYFISAEGGILSEDKLFVNEFDFACGSKISVYDTNTIKNIATDAYENGFSILILPFGSKIVETFAKEAPNIDQMFMKNITGWVSGINLGKNDGATAKVFSGNDLKKYEDAAVALHIELPKDKLASISIINIFTPNGDSPIIEFPTDSFEAEKCIINGKEVDFADYIADNRIDTKLPLVAEYSGSNINISIKEIAGKTVKFYAPVFKDAKYRFAKNIGDYVDEFEKNIKKNLKAKPVFSCNCILNYLYGGLEGKSTAPFMGPVTFGEVAYQLVNQTLVYITIQ